MRLSTRPPPSETVADYETAWLESQVGSSATEGPIAHVAHVALLVCLSPLGQGTQVAGTMLTLVMPFLPVIACLKPPRFVDLLPAEPIEVWQVKQIVYK